MRLHKILLLILSLFLMLSLCACEEKTQQEIITEFYHEYADMLAYDVATALTDYVHYEDPEFFEVGLRTANITIPEYEILSVEQLHDNLWAIHVWQKDLIGSDYTIYQFVGVLDGEYKVFLNPDNIPADLKMDIDFTPYYFEDFVSPDDIIGEVIP